MTQKTLFTIDQFVSMIDAGVFVEHVGQTELLRGELVSMSPASAQHADIIDWLNRWSTKETDQADFAIRVQSPIEIRHLESIPEPDLAWIRAGNYRTSYPKPTDVALLIEVSLSSARFDRREKAELYAEAGIQEYWLVDINQQTIEVRRRPKGILYQDIQVVGVSEQVSPLCQPETVLQISDLFPSA